MFRSTLYGVTALMALLSFNADGQSSTPYAAASDLSYQAGVPNFSNILFTINNKTKHNIPVYILHGGLTKPPKEVPDSDTTYAVSANGETTFAFTKPPTSGYFYVYPAATGTKGNIIGVIQGGSGWRPKQR